MQLNLFHEQPKIAHNCDLLLFNDPSYRIFLVCVCVSLCLFVAYNASLSTIPTHVTMFMNSIALIYASVSNWRILTSRRTHNNQLVLLWRAGSVRRTALNTNTPAHFQPSKYFAFHKCNKHKQNVE